MNHLNLPEQGNLSNQQIVTVLKSAMNLLVESGWTKGIAYDKDSGSYCLGGAIAEVCGVNPLEACFCGDYSLPHPGGAYSHITPAFAEVCAAVRNKLRSKVGCSGISGYNDHWVSDFSEVKDLMDELISDLSKETQDVGR